MTLTYEQLQRRIGSAGLARRACPIGAVKAYLPVQASFHMRAFAGSPAIAPRGG